MLLILAIVFPALAQADSPRDVEVRARHLAGPVHMLTATAAAGSGNLVFSAGPDGILLVDAFTPEWAERIRAALDSVSTAPVRFIGIVIGVAVSVAIAAFFPNLPARASLFWTAMGLLISISVGLFFGLYPAVKAANLDPVNCLRDE